MHINSLLHLPSVYETNVSVREIVTGIELNEAKNQVFKSFMIVVSVFKKLYSNAHRERNQN